MDGNDADLPLSGVTVVSLEQAIAAPLASRHLADWGARVIKIERPGDGDFCRDYDHVMNGMSSQFVWTNRSKESLAIDIKSAQGKKILDALLPKADVFIQNLAPGAAERLGLDAASLVQRFPRIIACDVSGYGSGGSYSDKKAYDLLVQCEAGLLAVNGTEAEPAKVGLSVVDIATGMYVLSGVLMALYRREKTGKGTAFQASLFDSITDWMSYPAYYTHSTGTPLPRTGAKHATIAPYGPFRVGDGKTIFFGIQNDREWKALCAVVLGDPDLADHPLYRTNPLRMQNRDALQRHIEDFFATKTSEQALRLLDEASIANAKLNSVESFLQHEQLRPRGRVRTVPTPCGPVMSFLPALTIPGVSPRMDPVPALGQHNQSILGELGLTEEP
jgi:itaconate CoA-transferase